MQWPNHIISFISFSFYQLSTGLILTSRSRAEKKSKAVGRPICADNAALWALRKTAENLTQKTLVNPVILSKVQSADIHPTPSGWCEHCFWFGTLTQKESVFHMFSQLDISKFKERWANSHSPSIQASSLQGPPYWFQQCHNAHHCCQHWHYPTTWPTTSTVTSSWIMLAFIRSFPTERAFKEASAQNNVCSSCVSTVRGKNLVSKERLRMLMMPCSRLKALGKMLAAKNNTCEQCLCVCVCFRCIFLVASS